MNFRHMCVLYVFIASSYAASEVEDDEGILILNEDNFEDVVAESKLLLVKFYTPQCGPCKDLAPHFTEAARQLRKETGAVAAARLAKIDCSRHRKLAERHNIQSHPTIRLHTADRWLDYEGEHSAAAILTWLRRRAEPAVSLATAEEAERFLEGSEAAVVGFFSGGVGAEGFLEWAAQEEGLSCALATTKELRKKYDAAEGSVVMFKKYDERRHDLAGPVDVAALSAWVGRLSPRLLPPFGEDTAETVFGSDGPGSLLLFVAAEGEQFEEVTAVVRAVAREHRGELLFTWVDVGEASFGRVLEFFGVQPSDAPCVRIVRPGDMAKFRPERAPEPLSQLGLGQFVQQFLAGKLKPYLLSEAPPAGWDSGPVLLLVGTTFDRVVLDTSRTVLVELYAPWCGHCRKLEPELEKLGEKYKNSDTVLIAKMDATKNELSHTRTRSFPTIKMWKKGTNEVVEYNGERTVGGMSRFIETDGEYGRAPPEDDYDDEDFEYSEDYEDDAEYRGHDEL